MQTLKVKVYSTFFLLSSHSSIAKNKINHKKHFLTNFKISKRQILVSAFPMFFNEVTSMIWLVKCPEIKMKKISQVGLVTSCCGHQTAFWGPACCGLG